jgi:hypothetical protein
MHSNLEIYADKIFYYRNVFKNPKNLIESIEKTNNNLCEKDIIKKWTTWESNSKDYIFGETKKTEKEDYETSSLETKEIYDYIYETLDKISEDYFKKNSINVSRKMAPISISKYYEGRMMGPHEDSGSGAIVSAVAYLNDNYSGGELVFPKQNISIKPEEGSVIFFPSIGGFIHDPRPMYGVEKYIIPAFWQGNN